MNRLPKFWIVAVAIVAVAGIVFVLVTPAPDELPSTGPHALNKLFSPPLNPVHLPQTLVPTGLVEIRSLVLWRDLDLLSLTCARLC
jgi:hypothetical protein